MKGDRAQLRAAARSGEAQSRGCAGGVRCCRVWPVGVPGPAESLGQDVCPHQVSRVEAGVPRCTTVRRAPVSGTVLRVLRRRRGTAPAQLR
ncbi:hypothetical protein NDU88_010531 [Pleurodeles waltl]|uniref:Uncharacterized protein n=1 Tax=Pleurodeles waltl TaxID=8319 RepID=A0AAV7R0U8_PLEWA|nr:hypothetical protein NDU88_010531 [Pleurodeles waltl]